MNQFTNSIKKKGKLLFATMAFMCALELPEQDYDKSTLTTLGIALKLVLKDQTIKIE